MLVRLGFQLSSTHPMTKRNSLVAAQHCVGADGTEVIGESSILSAAAQFHRCDRESFGWVTDNGICSIRSRGRDT
jgi:hypothetical protein